MGDEVTNTVEVRVLPSPKERAATEKRDRQVGAAILDEFVLRRAAIWRALPKEQHPPVPRWVLDRLALRFPDYARTVAHEVST